MGVPEDERSFTALRDTTRYHRLAAAAVPMPPPTGIFPRLEMPEETA